MTARRTFPRSANHHEAATATVLERYAFQTRWTPALPVPVDRIVEQLGLAILYEELDEPPGTKILGALDPATGIIRLNERHLDLFEDVIGPEQFTLAHELGHWTYDAVDGRSQGSLFTTPAPRVLCRSLGPRETADIREINANGFASALLMPEHLVRTAIAVPFDSRRSFNETAARWGVSRTALRIRLEKLGMAWSMPV